MTCTINIDNVSFLPNATPPRLRVYGHAPGCTQVQLTTSNPTVTSPVSATADPSSNGRFLLEAMLQQALTCDAPNPPTVTVSCLQTKIPNDPCMDAVWAGTAVPCCTGRITSVNAFVPLGSLTPTAIDVQGICYGCASNVVTVTADRMVGSVVQVLVTPGMFSVDPVSGGFSGRLPLTASGVNCGDLIDVTVTCASGSCNIAAFNKGLSCPQCFRAQLAAVVAPCAPGATTAQVSITATIGLPSGAAPAFSLDFGNGASPCPIQPTPATSPTSLFQQTCVGTYNTNGQFTATLDIPTRQECGKVSITFRVDCGQCPTVTTTADVQNCVTAGPGVDPKIVDTRPVVLRVDVPASVPANLKTTATFEYGGFDVGTSNPAAMPPFPGKTHGAAQILMGPGAITETIHMSPGTYFPNVNLSFSLVTAQGELVFCSPPLTLDIVAPGQMSGVTVGPCLGCPLGLIVTPTQNPPMPPHWKFQADVDWGSSPPPMPPVPVNYQWTMIRPDGTQASATTPTKFITTEDGQGWFNTVGTTAATMHGGIDLSVGGHYSVSVSANFAHNSGLPIDSATGEVSCNTTGPAGFDVQGPPPPNCQILGGVSQMVPLGMSSCADPTQGIAAPVAFTVTGTNLGSGPYVWNFGDTASGAANTATTSLLTATHTYSTPGNYSVTVDIAATASCPASHWGTGVTVPLCPCPAGQIRLMDGTCGVMPGSSGEGLGCLILRWIAVALVALGIIGALILLCFWPQLSQFEQGVIMGIGIGLFVVGIILFVIWVIVCKTKPCLWGWLLAAQVCLAVGLFCLYMINCCTAVAITSAVIFLVLAVVFAAIWVYRCMPTFCQAMKELTPVVGDVAILIGIVVAVPFIRNCVNGWIVLGEGVGTAVIIFILAGCINAPTKTGGPAR